MGMYIPNMKSEQFYDLCKEHGLEIIAVPVPAHGRLIDANELMEEFRLPKDLLDPAQVLMHITGVRAVIQTAPTIIPAEEGE